MWSEQGRRCFAQKNHFAYPFLAYEYSSFTHSLLIPLLRYSCCDPPLAQSLSPLVILSSLPTTRTCHLKPLIQLTSLPVLPKSACCSSDSPCSHVSQHASSLHPLDKGRSPERRCRPRHVLPTLDIHYRLTLPSPADPRRPRIPNSSRDHHQRVRSHCFALLLFLVQLPPDRDGDGRFPSFRWDGGHPETPSTEYAQPGPERELHLGIESGRREATRYRSKRRCGHT